jgi:hypothetical protein
VAVNIPAIATPSKVIVGNGTVSVTGLPTATGTDGQLPDGTPVEYTLKPRQFIANAATGWVFDHYEIVARVDSYGYIPETDETYHTGVAWPTFRTPTRIFVNDRTGAEASAHASAYGFSAPYALGEWHITTYYDGYKHFYDVVTQYTITAVFVEGDRVRIKVSIKPGVNAHGLESHGLVYYSWTKTDGSGQVEQGTISDFKSMEIGVNGRVLIDNPTAADGCEFRCIEVDGVPISGTGKTFVGDDVDEVHDVNVWFGCNKILKDAWGDVLKDSGQAGAILRC